MRLDKCPNMDRGTQLLRAAIILFTWYIVVPPQTVLGINPKSKIFTEGRSDKDILDELLSHTRYDKRLRPPIDGTLTVNMSVLLLSLASPDESSLKYEVEFLLQQQWHDPRLEYFNQTTYDFLNAIHHHSDVWLPDTYFIMHGDFKDPLIPVKNFITHRMQESFFIYHYPNSLYEKKSEPACPVIT
ncbi:hypothetical protein M8J76_007405 [Diaphorina citri]|nr:hypothetical protein M8J76_007405 [Diaphorina citri]